MLRALTLATLLAGCARPVPPTPPAARPAQVTVLERTRGVGGALGDVEGAHRLGEQSGAFAIYAPAEAHGRPHGLLVLLHADDASPRRPTRAPALRRLAAELGLLLVAIDSPGPVDSGCWWSPHKHLRADYLVDLLQTQVFARYDVDPTRVFLAGKSGGAFWASGAPFYRELPFYGGVVGVCGGDVPRAESDVDWCAIDETQDDPELEIDPAAGAEVAARWRLFLAHTSGDEWAGHSARVASLYADLGGEVARVITGSGGHCALDEVRWLEAGVRWADR